MNNLNLALQGSRVAIRHRADCRQTALQKVTTIMLNPVLPNPNAAALSALELPDRAPFTAKPVMRLDPKYPEREDVRKTHYTAVATWLYINRIEGSDCLGVLPPAYMAKADDLVATGRRHPIQNLALKYKNGRAIWDEADAATTADPDHAAALHIIGTLQNGTPAEWQRTVERYLDDHFSKLGMVVDWAIHAGRDDQGDWAPPPHFHGLVTARRFRDDQRKGQRQRTWLYNKAQVDRAEDAWLAATGLPPRTFV